MEYAIYDLIAAKISGEKLSPEEEAALLHWIAALEPREREYGALSLFERPVELIREKGGIDHDAGYARVLERIERVSRKRRNRRLRHWGYAAAIALFIGTGWWFRTTGVETDAIAVTGVLPGSGQVLLTTGSGDVLALSQEVSRIALSDSLLHVINTGNTLHYDGTPSRADVEYNTLAVMIGGEYRVRLADGTLVFLNSASELKYPVVFTGNTREVFLTGEAWFEVKQDTAHPFIVHADDMNIKVLGTSFGVRAYPRQDIAMTTLVSGSVEIMGGDRPYVLVPGEQIVYRKEQRQATIRGVDTELYVSWKDGYYKLRNTSLEEIMSTLSVWYGVEVSYRDEAAKELAYSGRLRRYDRIEDILDFLRETNDVIFEINGDNIVIRLK